MKKFGLILILAFTTFFSSCEKDLYDEAIKNSTSENENFTLEYLSGNIAEKLKKITEQEIKTYRSKIQNRNLDTIDYGTIKYDEVMKVEDNSGNKTYMFRVDHPDQTNEKFYNMVFQEKIDGSKYVKLFEYNMTPEFAQDYYMGLKDLTDFDGSYNYRLVAYNEAIRDPNNYGDGDGDYGSGGGGYSGGGGTNDGNTGGPVGGSSYDPMSGNTSSGVGSIGSAGGNPCTEGGGSLGQSGGGSGGGAGGAGSGGGSGGGGSEGGSSSCYILVGTVHKVYTSSSCYYDITYLYVDCGGNGNRGINDNSIKNRGANDANPCTTSNNGVTIFQPANAPTQFSYQLNSLTGSTETYNTFNSLNPTVKSIVFNYITQGSIATNNAATFFSTLFHNNQLTAFSQLTAEMQTSILNYEIANNFSVDSQVFVNWEINYLMQHPNLSLIEFENQFMGTSEGQDGEYDTFWDNPNLTFPPQNLPTWADFDSVFPRDSDPLYDTPQKMYEAIGGDILTFYTGPQTNTCAIRLSYALNYSGVVIPHIQGQTFQGDDGLYYFKAAYQINIWMRKTFGTNPATSTTPFNSNHHYFSGAQAGVHGANLPVLLNGIKGIYSIYSSNFSWASGHADLLNNNATCGNNCHFYDAPISRLDVWELH